MFALRSAAFSTALLTALVGMLDAQGKKHQPSATQQSGASSGSKTYLKFCASCHGEGGKGDGPAATALQPPPSDLTTLAKQHDGKYPVGYVSAVLKFGKGFAAHGSADMPVWGLRFKTIDPAHDPTGQQHIDDVVAYIGLLQAK